MRRMKRKVKSHEKRRILLFGETIRENPRTILLSIPVFFFGFLFYSLIGDREGKAGSLGHCGITFKNYYRHHWKKKFLLEIAYFLINSSSKLATGEGKVSNFIHCGQIAFTLGKHPLAVSKFREALKEAEDINHKSIQGNIYNHMAIVELKKGKLNEARKYLDKAVDILEGAVKKKPDSLYLHVWFSGAELVMGEYFIKKGDKGSAKKWAIKAQKRVKKYNLKTRKQDVKNLLKRI